MRNFIVAFAMVIIITVGGMYFVRRSQVEAHIPGIEEVEIQRKTVVETKEVALSEIEDNYLLNLVNHQYPVNQSIIGENLVEAFLTVPVSERDTMLHEEALYAVSQMFAAANSQGVQHLILSSGYRSLEEQRQIYEEASNKSYVMPFGHSEHHTGLAADIFGEGLTEDEMANSLAGKWLEENAWEYGFILRYPKEKVASTGISYEPWHFRYVGQPHAAFLRKENMSLEEYMAYLQEEGGYTIEVDDQKYEILYQTPENGTIQVPENKMYHVSSDNTGGYIMTIKE